MPDTTLRQLTMLQLIPRRPPGKNTSQLQAELADRDYPVNLRTIQRDLDHLSGIFGLTHDGARPPRWFWAVDANALSLPAHDPHSALTWQLIEEYLKPLLPRALQRDAGPQFRAARRYLDQMGGGRLKRWKQRVRVIPRAFQLIPPQVKGEILDAIYDGLFDGVQLKARYRSRGSRTARELHIHPLAMVLREGIIYLLATIDDFEDIRQLVAHRFTSAELTGRPAREPADFDLDEYIRQGGFAYVRGGPINLVIRVDGYAGQHLLESPMAPEQKEREMADGRLEIAARVLDTEQLRWWLLGLGDNVEVVRPAPLRRYMKEQAQALARRYGAKG